MDFPNAARYGHTQQRHTSSGQTSSRPRNTTFSTPSVYTPPQQNTQQDNSLSFLACCGIAGAFILYDWLTQ